MLWVEVRQRNGKGYRDMCAHIWWRSAAVAVFVAGSAAAQSAAPPLLSRLEVAVAGVAPDAPVSIALYPESAARDFPTADSKALVQRVAPTAGKAVAAFDGLAPGRYALSVYQDLDGDGRLKSNFLGIPREPVAVSNNAPARFGPPRFADAAFAVSRPVERQQVRLTALNGDK
jgi:uncharacterized protein (DUF2141 family)